MFGIYENPKSIISFRKGYHAVQVVLECDVFSLNALIANMPDVIKVEGPLDFKWTERSKPAADTSPPEAYVEHPRAQRAADAYRAETRRRQAGMRLEPMDTPKIGRISVDEALRRKANAEMLIAEIKLQMHRTEADKETPMVIAKTAIAIGTGKYSLLTDREFRLVYNSGLHRLDVAKYLRDAIQAVQSAVVDRMQAEVHFDWHPQRFPRPRRPKPGVGVSLFL